MIFFFFLRMENVFSFEKEQTECSGLPGAEDRACLDGRGEKKFFLGSLFSKDE